jgi:hypothetical protein
MTTKQIMTQLETTIQDLLPHLHGHQLKALTALCYGIAQARHCSLGQAALPVPTAAQPQSTERRFRRLISNPKLNSLQCALCYSRILLQSWKGRRLILLLDETPLSNALRVMKISLGYQGRALPLVWCSYEPDALPASQPRVAFGLLARLARCLPAQTPVVLLADRGLCWPRLIDLCRKRGWDFVLRAQGSTRLRLKDGRRCALQELVPHPGSRFYGEGEAFKKAGWRPVNVVAVWPRGHQEPWLLVTSLEPNRTCCHLYRQRMWQEESFRDEKSHGFNWQRSRVRLPAHASRLLLAMALAQIWLLSLGTQARRKRFHTQFAPAHRKTLSLFTLGWRYLYCAIWKGWTIHCRLTFFIPRKRLQSNVS